jgi:DNA-binding NarL/FixJ family response regulator
MPVNLIVMEDHPLFRQATVDLLVTQMDDAEIAYSGTDLTIAKTICEQMAVSCIVLDLDLGTGVPPLDTVEDLAATGVPIVIISALAEPALIRAALARGITAYVPKKSQPVELVLAVRQAIRGLQYTSPELASMLLQGEAGGVQLSEQERKALILYASGLKMDTVARRMGVSTTTAKEYIKRVRQKYAKSGTALPTKVDLHQLARSQGLLP